MNKDYCFIVLEGLDGCGKSTIARKLSEELICKIYKTPHYLFDQIREIIDEEASTDARFFFYLSSVLDASEKIERLLDESHVVCDRYIYSTLCYHYVLNPKLSSFNIDCLDILRPDFAFYLRASYQERLKRISIREHKNLDEFPINNYHSKDFLRKVEREFNNLKDVILIDTDKVSVDEVTKKIQKHITISINK